jgi:hypothetical protein
VEDAAQNWSWEAQATKDRYIPALLSVSPWAVFIVTANAFVIGNLSCGKFSVAVKCRI